MTKLTKLPRNEPGIKKHYFHAHSPEGITKDFQRQAYQLLDNEKYTHPLSWEMRLKLLILHMVMLNTIIHPIFVLAHENLEHKTKNEKPNVVHKKLIASMNTSSELVPVTTPRNMQQVQSIRHRVL